MTGTFFDVLGLKAERGRLFSEEDSAPGTVKPVVVMSHQLWRQRFNDDAAAIGQTLTVNGTPLTIIGVIEPPFDDDAVAGRRLLHRRRRSVPAGRAVPDAARAAGRRGDSCSASAG